MLKHQRNDRQLVFILHKILRGCLLDEVRDNLMKTLPRLAGRRAYARHDMRAVVINNVFRKQRRGSRNIWMDPNISGLKHFVSG